MQYHFRTFGDAMYAPCERSSLARVRSTRLRRDVTFLALSRGTVCPQLVHWTTPDDPLPPFLRPLLALFSGIAQRRGARAPYYTVCAPPAGIGRAGPGAAGRAPARRQAAQGRPAGPANDAGPLPAPVQRLNHLRGLTVGGLKGLCHKCLASNVEVTVLRGLAMCAGCASAEAGAAPGGEKR